MKTLKLFLCSLMFASVSFGLDPAAESLVVIKPPNSSYGFPGAYYMPYFSKRTSAGLPVGLLEVQIAGRSFDVYLFPVDRSLKSTSKIKVELIQGSETIWQNANECKNAKVIPIPGSTVTINDGFDYSNNTKFSEYIKNYNSIAKLTMTIPDARTKLTFRVTYTDKQGTYYKCNSSLFTVRPKEFVLYNFKEFKDAFGKTIPVGPIGAKHFRQTTTSPTYTKNVKIRDTIPVLKAGKEYPSIGLAVLDWNDNIMTSYNGSLEGVVLGYPGQNDISVYGSAYKYSDYTIYHGATYGSPTLLSSTWSGQGYPTPYYQAWGISEAPLKREGGNSAVQYFMQELDCGVTAGKVQVYSEIGRGDYGPEVKIISEKVIPNQTVRIGHVKFTNGIARNLKMPDGKAFKFDEVGFVRLIGYQSPNEVTFEGSASTNGYHATCRGNIIEYEITKNMEWKMIENSYGRRSDNYDNSLYRCSAQVGGNELYFIPDHFEISNVKLHNFNSDKDNEGMTYIRSVGELGKEKIKAKDLYTGDDTEIEKDKEADMYAELSFDVVVKDVNGKTPIGYTRNCFARDVDFKLDITKPIHELEIPAAYTKTPLEYAKEKIGYFNDPDKDEFTHVRGIMGSSGYLVKRNPLFSYERAEKKTEYVDSLGVTHAATKSDGYFTIKADSWDLGKAHVKVRLNFDRDIAHPIKPFEVSSDMFNITEIKDTIYAKGMEQVKPNSFTPPGSSEITKAKFYYGTVYSPSYKALAPDTIDTTTYFGVFCGMCDMDKFKTTSGTWQRLGAMSGWYINELHNQFKPNDDKNYGKVFKYELQNPSGNITQKGPELTYDYRNTISFEGTKAGKATVLMPTNPWLVYAPNFSPTPGGTLPTANSFNIIYTGAGYWAGKSVDKTGKENATGSFIGSEIPQSRKSSDRVNW